MAQASASVAPARRRALRTAAAAALIAAAAVAVLVLASQPESHTRAELALQRSQLAQVSRQLAAIEGPLQREAQASRAAWRSIDGGLPAHPSARLASEVAAASSAAQALPAPAFLEVRHELIGPAERVAALFHEFFVLSQHGWAHVNQAIAALRSGPAAVARFERANAGLYVESIYDAHFSASLIGERVLSSYERLAKEAGRFGSSLTGAEVEGIASAYSPQAVRLTPHLWRELLSQR